MTDRDREYLRCLARAYQLSPDPGDDGHYSEETTIESALNLACERLDVTNTERADLLLQASDELADEGFFQIEATP